MSAPSVAFEPPKPDRDSNLGPFHTGDDSSHRGADISRSSAELFGFRLRHGSFLRLGFSGRREQVYQLAGLT